MTDVQVPCPHCIGQGWIHTSCPWISCGECAGIGRIWSPGGPLFGCTMMLSERIAGEVVELGNGDVGRVLWHTPRAAKRVFPEITYLGLIDEFGESHTPTRYPSCVGVRKVIDSRARVVDDDHRGDRGADREDPMKRKTSSLL